MPARTRTTVVVIVLAVIACRGDSVSQASTSRPGMLGRIAAALGFRRSAIHVPPYTGADAHGIPYYAHVALSAADRALLLRVYGVEDPDRLHVTDSTVNGLLTYDTEVKRCGSCLVNSYQLGFVSVRRPGESWEAVERRVRAMHPSDFSPAAHLASTSTAELDPAIRVDVDRMLADAQRAGFALRIIATYRSPEREALLMAEGRGRTHTLTSMHTYGRAIDLLVGDGKITNPATRKQWIAFRQWVVDYRNGEFRILGEPDRTWDWSHVEIPRADLGFRSIGDALVRARRCLADSTGRHPCDFPPHLPPATALPTAQTARP